MPKKKVHAFSINWILCDCIQPTMLPRKARSILISQNLWKFSRARNTDCIMVRYDAHATITRPSKSQSYSLTFLLSSFSWSLSTSEVRSSPSSPVTRCWFSFSWVSASLARFRVVRWRFLWLSSSSDRFLNWTFNDSSLWIQPKIEPIRYNNDKKNLFHLFYYPLLQYFELKALLRHVFVRVRLCMIARLSNHSREKTQWFKLNSIVPISA